MLSKRDIKDNSVNLYERMPIQYDNAIWDKD